MIERSEVPALDLRTVSVQVILDNQSESGAYIASPSFEQYRYSWLRDGSFIGYAMLLAGQPDSTRRFLEWTNATIMRHRDRMMWHQATVEVEPPPTRYSLDGVAVEDDWPNHQIDGYGAWLWLLAEYASATGEDHLLHRYRESIRLTVSYLTRTWSRPNYDCWEEYGDRLHASTLACVYGGLSAINRYLAERALHDLTEEVRDLALSMTAEGRFRKNSHDDGIDASLLWLSTPFRVVHPQDPVMRETVRAIEDQLLVDGGVRRYSRDTYYGGGRWILLTCWLGWYYVQVGKTEQARAALSWVESQVRADGALPEQVTDLLVDPDSLPVWEKKWGPVATPLLWSHAMYIVLRHDVEAGS